MVVEEAYCQSVGLRTHEKDVCKIYSSNIALWMRIKMWMSNFRQVYIVFTN